jgi:hypothetical protein
MFVQWRKNIIAVGIIIWRQARDAASSNKMGGMQARGARIASEMKHQRAFVAATRTRTLSLNASRRRISS